MGYGDGVFTGQVGYGSRDLEDAVVGACGEALLLHGALEEAFGVGAEFAVLANLAGAHLCVGVGAGFAGFGFLGEALGLGVAGVENALADGGGVFAGGAGAEFAVLDGGDLDVDVDAVEEGGRRPWRCSAG